MSRSIKPPSLITARPAWEDDARPLRIGFANGALRGITEKGARRSEGAMLGVTLSFLPGELGFVLLCLMVVLLPFLLFANIFAERGRRQQVASWWDNDDYLKGEGWNFRFDKDEIAGAYFFEVPSANWSQLPAQKLRLLLSNGERWEFTLSSRHDAQKLKRELDQQQIVTRMHKDARSPAWAHVLSTNIASFF